MDRGPWIISCFLLTSCALPEATTPSADVVLAQEQFTEYWRQLERRWPAYFESICRPPPELPDSAAIENWVKFEEVPRAYLSTCTYSGRLIRVGDDKWQSGCVPHEMGHAVCDYLNSPAGCSTFEHPNADLCN